MVNRGPQQVAAGPPAAGGGGGRSYKNPTIVYKPAGAGRGIMSDSSGVGRRGNQPMTGGAPKPPSMPPPTTTDDFSEAPPPAL